MGADLDLWRSPTAATYVKQAGQDFTRCLIARRDLRCPRVPSLVPRDWMKKGSFRKGSAVSKSGLADRLVIRVHDLKLRVPLLGEPLWGRVPEGRLHSSYKKAAESQTDPGMS
jgi:hypothetical protein